MIVARRFKDQLSEFPTKDPDTYILQSHSDNVFDLYMFNVDR